MTRFNYSQVCSEILKVLSPKQKEVILRRFALEGKRRETLESIGKDFEVTRERIRQIERDGFSKLKPEIKKYQKIFSYFKNCLKKTGNLRKEESFLSELGSGKFQSQVYFLLTLGHGFERFGESNDFYSLWATDRASWVSAQKAIDSVYERLKKSGRPLNLEELSELKPLAGPLAVISSYLEVSKKIQRNLEGFWGLKDWPEINPKRIKDKVYLVFKKEQKPLHFSQVANLIDSALPQTVRNELIKDSRFVLVGRGIYALKEWGYEEGVVKDVILNILKAAGRPLKKEEILEKTLKQRLVKENTIFLNLSNKKYFLRTSDGFYTVKEA